MLSPVSFKIVVVFVVIVVVVAFVVVMVIIPSKCPTVGSLFQGDPMQSCFTIKVSEANPDGVALRNLDFLDKVEVVLIAFGVVR